MQSNRSFIFLSLCVFLALLSKVESVHESSEVNLIAKPPYASIHIGVILDLNSPMGAMADICLSKARSDFYTEHPDYKTRLFLHTRSAEEEVDMAFAALELLKNQEVESVLGPELSTESTFVSELGAKAHIPVISFTAKSQSFSPRESPYFLRTTPDDTHQTKAIADICQGFEWYEVVILYEDSEYGNQFVSKVNKALQKYAIRITYISAVHTTIKDSDLMKKLNKLKTLQTRVFLVHMNTSLGCKLFILSRKAGMMSEGYVWLIADSLSNFLPNMDLTCTESMEGVLGIMPHVARSKKLDKFKDWWKKNALQMRPDIAMDLNVYGMWAYDTVWALGLAAEKSLPINSAVSNISQTRNESEISNLRVSQFGPRLQSELVLTKFEGLTGEFELVNRNLQPSAFEIFNMIGTGHKTVGYWIPGKGISPKLAAVHESTYSTSTKNLRKITWPGDTFVKPIGWAIPNTGKLKIGVPKKEEYTEFVNVQINPLTNETSFGGFSIDIFRASVDLLPFKLDYELIPYTGVSRNSNGSYNDMLHKILDKTYDFVVGDTTILAHRSTYVDFTLPYTASGITMVVRHKRIPSMWIFLKPLRWDLWLTIFLACFFIGAVISKLESQTKNNSDEPMVVPRRQGYISFIWFPITVLAFPERNMVTNKWSRFVLVIWIFVAYTLMQSYTAKLSSIFTVNQLKFSLSRDIYVGFQHGSFVKDFLINELQFNLSRIRNYSKIEEFHEAMSRGGRRGGIDVIFAEIPYMRLLITRYGSEYKMVGPTYKTDGFGFAFPMGSPLVNYFSRAILNVTQGTNMAVIEKVNFGPNYPPEKDSINEESPGLRAYNFGGPFIIIGSAALFALFCSVTSIGQQFTQMATPYVHWFVNLLTFNGSESRVHSSADANGESPPPEEVDDEPQEANAVELVRLGQVLEPQDHDHDHDPNDSATQGEAHNSDPPATNASSIPSETTSEAHQH